MWHASENCTLLDKAVWNGDVNNLVLITKDTKLSEEFSSSNILLSVGILPPGPLDSVSQKGFHNKKFFHKNS